MATFTFAPGGDRGGGVSLIGWFPNPFVNPAWDKVDEGPGWETGSIDHDAFSGGHDGAPFEFGTISPTVVQDTFNAFSYFGEVRVWGTRIVIRASLREANSRIVASIGRWAVYTDGIPAVDVDSTTLYVPGTPSVQDFVGPGFLETVGAFRGGWSLYKNDGVEWTAAELDKISLKVRGWGALRIYTIWMDVDMRLGAVTGQSTPHYPNQAVSIWAPISWRFNNGGDGTQKKYMVRIFTAAQYAAGGAGVNTDTKACTYESGIVWSNANFHDFTTRVGATKVRGIANGTWTVAIRTAKDWKGGDWWTPFTVQTMIVTGYTSTLTSPTANQVYTTTTTPSFTATTTIPTPQIMGSVWRVYAEPVGGFPSTFDPDTTDQDPFWYGELSGTPANLIIPDLPHCLPNGNYRMYMRFQEVLFGDYTPWVFNNFSLNVASPPAPQIFTATPDVNNAKVSLAADFYSGVLADNVRGIEILRTVPGYDDTRVLLPAPDIAHGLVQKGIRIPGTSFASWRIANATGLHSTNLDVQTGVIQTTWATIAAPVAIASRWDVLGGAFRSWLFRILTNRTLELRWSTNGTAETFAVSTVALPTTFTAGQEIHLRAQLSVGSPYNVLFFYSIDFGANWIQLGTTVVGGGATSIFNTTSNAYIEVGASDQSLGNLSVSTYTHFRLRNGLAGTILLESAANVTPNALTTIVGSAMAIISTDPSWYYRVLYEDYEVPFNKTVTYKARTVILNATPQYRFSAYTTAATILSIQKVWIHNLSDPTLNSRFLTADAWHGRSTTKLRASHHPLGRTLPIVMKQEGEGEEFEYKFTVLTEAIVNKLIAILDGGSTIFLATPKKSWYVEVSSSWSQQDHIFDMRDGESDARIITVPLLEVGSPYVPSIL